MSQPTSLCELVDVKRRLEIPDADTSLDAAIEGLRLGFEERILDLTGFTFDGGVKTEELTDVQLGRSRVMRFRPIEPLDASRVTQYVRLDARSMASDTYSQIIGELRDREEGRIMALASELTPVFPPVGGMAPWYRWRQMIWPVVRFTYKVTPLGDGTDGTMPIPAMLKTAAVEWVASVVTRSGAGALKSLGLERVQETYIDVAVPPHIQGMLYRYIREKARLAF
jgi:hypothetical protein